MTILLGPDVFEAGTVPTQVVYGFRVRAPLSSRRLGVVKGKNVKPWKSCVERNINDGSGAASRLTCGHHIYLRQEQPGHFKLPLAMLHLLLPVPSRNTHTMNLGNKGHKRRSARMFTNRKDERPD